MGNEIITKPRTYTTSQAAEILGVTEHVLRYMEKNLDGLLDISRDEQYNREFTEKDINLLKKVNEIRELGITNYKAIRVIISKNLLGGMDAGVSNQIEYENLSVSMATDKVEAVINSLVNQITLNMNDLIAPKFEEMKLDIINQLKEGSSIIEKISDQNKEMLPMCKEIDTSVRLIKKQGLDLYIQNTAIKKEIENKLDKIEERSKRTDEYLIKWREEYSVNTKKDYLKGEGKVKKKGFFGFLKK